jgi:hypothetical protein
MNTGVFPRASALVGVVVIGIGLFPYLSVAEAGRDSLGIVPRSAA